jgi:hypothetical protein
MNRLAKELAPRYKMDEAKTEICLRQELQVVMIKQVAASINRSLDKIGSFHVFKCG